MLQYRRVRSPAVYICIGCWSLPWHVVSGRGLRDIVDIDPQCSPGVDAAVNVNSVVNIGLQGSEHLVHALHCVVHERLVESGTAERVERKN